MARRHLDWMAQAEIDYEFAQVAMASNNFEWCCFICQQASEKAVKALLESMNAKSKTHSISQMLKALKIEDITILKAGKRLDHFYILPRYPNGFDSGYPRLYYDREDGEQALKDAKAVLVFCRNNLKD
jgi:HEPN domain-containing protein